jgi:hypothetical protein
VVDALQRIEEGQTPEADERQAMAPDRPLQQDRHEVVHQAPAERRDEQAHQVVDEQPSDRAGARAGDGILGQQVAHGVGQERPHEGGHEVPQRDVHRPLAPPDRHHEIHGHQRQPEQGQRVDPEGRLAPLEALGAETHRQVPPLRELEQPGLILERGADDDADGRQPDDRLPGHEDEPGKPAARDLVKREPGHRPMERAEEGIGQEAVGHGVGMDHPPAAGREQLDAVQRVPVNELQGHEDARRHRHRQERQRGDVVREDDLLVDEILVGRMVGSGRGVGLVRGSHGCSVCRR